MELVPLPFGGKTELDLFGVFTGEVWAWVGSLSLKLNAHTNWFVSIGFTNDWPSFWIHSIGLNASHNRWQTNNTFHGLTSYWAFEPPNPPKNTHEFDTGMIPLADSTYWRSIFLRRPGSAIASR